MDLPYRLSSHRAACKQWSAGLGVLILLIGALAGLNPTKMLWAAGPLLLLGLVEAGYAAQERRYAELLKAPSASSGQAPSAGSGQGALLPEPASASMVRTTLAALSLSIWPFYLGLFAIVGIGGEQMAASNKKVLVSNGPPANYAPAGMVRTVAANGVTLGCGSGGCGSSAGCGSGSCGASAGKGCSCGGGGAAPTQQMKRPVQPYVQTATGPVAYQGAAYQQMPQGQTMPQQAQYQRLPNGAIANARPPVRTMPMAAPGQSVPTAPLSAVTDAPLQNAVAPSVAAEAVAATPAPAPLSKPAAPDAASKKTH